MPPSRTRSSWSVILLAALQATCTAKPPSQTADETVLDRKRQGVRALIALAEKGPLTSFDDALVVVDEAVVQDVFSSALPFERTVERFQVQIEKTAVHFDDGCALVRLDGRASLRGPEGAGAVADVTVYGELDLVELDPDSGVLRGQIRILAFDASRVAVLGLTAPSAAERLVEDLGRSKLEAWSSLSTRVEIPVRFESALTLPAMGPRGGVKVDAATIPVRALVKSVVALRGKLWIAVEASLPSDQ